METLDITIIGAGVVGLAIVERLSKRFESIAVVEKHDSFGRETSSRNSEVIHDGSHYPQDSLKAQLSVEGNRMLYEICLNNQINHKKTGKLTVAVTDEEISRLEAFERNGRANGVEDLIFYEPAQIKKIEPLISARLALMRGSIFFICAGS